MTSTSAVSMSVVVPSAALTKTKLPSPEGFFRPLPVRPSKRLTASTGSRFQLQASLKEKLVTGLTAGALTASMIIPEVAQAADSTLSPSLNNFLLSIAAGGTVLVGISPTLV